MWFGGGVVGGLVESRNYHSIPDPFIRQQMSSQFHAPKLKKNKTIQAIVEIHVLYSFSQAAKTF